MEGDSFLIMSLDYGKNNKKKTKTVSTYCKNDGRKDYEKHVKDKQEEKGSVGKPKQRWFDEPENYLIKIGVRSSKKWLRIETPGN
jgi:hypothetical protein